MSSVTINGQTVRVGMLCESIREEFEGIPIGPGIKVTVVSVGSSSIAIKTDHPRPGWNNLNNEVPNNTGLWITTLNFFSYFKEAARPRITIIKECPGNNSDLKGLSGKVLDQNEHGLFVELEKDIQGISFDGLGKAGHCTFIPKDCVEFVATTKQKSKKAKK